MRSGVHKPPPQQTVIFGRAVGMALDEALPAHAERVLVVTTRSLAVDGGLLDRVQGALGSRCVEVVSDIRAHAPREDVSRIANRMSASRADAVVALGGGSVGDATKVARLCLANGVRVARELDLLRSGQPLAAPRLPFIMVPTTLSAGEYTVSGGVTDEAGPRKESYAHPGLAPDVVILDPAMTLSTPKQLWFGTGLRAIDHAVEGWCSLNRTPHSDALALHALTHLVPGLRRSAAVPDDLEARSACQTGAWLSIQGYVCHVDYGASHGIGHALGGTAGMAHGETSCVMLPHVLRYNARVNCERQQQLASALGAGARSLADIVAELVAELGLPARLRDAGVTREILPRVAAEAFRDPWIATNPRPVGSQEDLLQLLEEAW